MSGPTQTPVSTPATLQVKVAAKRTEAQDICSLELVAADGGALPAFTAGAHIAIKLPNGMLRKYSLCNDPAERDRYQVAIKREVNGRGGSLALIDKTKVGDTLMVAPPVNDFGLPQRG